MPTPDRPNVVLILSDQHRFDYLACAGPDYLRTPNLDRLAGMGVRFGGCTSNAPVCVPARVGLATGMLPIRFGSLDNQSFLPFSQETYYQRLRNHGYRVGCAGKIDLAKPDPYNGRHGDRPQAYAFGFTHPLEAEGKMHAGNFPEPQGPYGFHLQEKGLYETFHNDYRTRARTGWFRDSRDSVLPAEDFEDTWIGRRAVEWIDTVPLDFPFHYFVSFVGPHDPFDPPTHYADHFRDAEPPDPIPADPTGKPAFVRQRQCGEEVDHRRNRRQYAAAVEAIDDQVGAILDALERRGILDTTYVLYSSDHGEMLGDHGLYTKCVPYEASLRVPLLAAGPGIEGGRTSDALVELIDLNPTICEMAGVAPRQQIDGQSFLPLLRGDTETHRAETVAALTHFRCIRTERYKLIDTIGDAREVYDLEADPEERHNIAGASPELERDLCGRLGTRLVEGQCLR